MSTESPEGSASSTTRVDFLRRAGALGLTLAVGDAIAGPGSGFAAARRLAAAPSGTIHFENYQGWIGKGEYKRFKARYPQVSIKESYFFDPFDVVTKIVAGKSKADMALLTSDSAPALVAAGKAEKLDPSKIPNYRNVRNFVKKGAYAQYGVTTDYTRWGIAYRSDKVKEKMTSWADFFRLAAKYPGKFAIQDYNRSGLGAALIAVGRSPNATSGSDLLKAQRLLIKAKPNLGPLVTKDFSKLLISGQLYAFLDFEWDTRLGQIQDPRIKWVETQDGIMGSYEGWVAIKDSPNLDAVQALMNFHFAPREYANFINSVGPAYVEPRSLITPYLDPAVVKDNYFLNPPASVVRRIEFLTYLGDATRENDRAWNAFKAA